MNRTGGDDLDDDFVPDDLVALSDAEDEEAVHSADGEDIAALLSADEGNAAPSTSQAAVEKKRKRRAKEKERKAKVHNKLSSYGPHLTAALVETKASRKQRRSPPDLRCCTVPDHACRLSLFDASKIVPKHVCY